jgi:hypothetical protein
MLFKKGKSKYMGMKQKINFLKIILYVLCILIGGILAAYSSLKFAWLMEVLLIIIAISVCFDWRFMARKSIIIGIVVSLSGLSLLYNIKYLYPYLKEASSTRNMTNTQISIPQSPYHKDLWIYPIVNKKKVNLYYANKWCWNYFKAFSKSTKYEPIINYDSNIDLNDSTKNKHFIQVGYTLFGGISSLFSANVIEEISKREVAPYLYLSMDGLAETNEVVILTDEEYGVYIMSLDTLKNMVGDVAK